jgi:hypothetical protein
MSTAPLLTDKPQRPTGADKETRSRVSGRPRDRRVQSFQGLADGIAGACQPGMNSTLQKKRLDVQKLHAALRKTRWALGTRPALEAALERLIAAHGLGFACALDYLIAVLSPPLLPAIRAFYADPEAQGGVSPKPRAAAGLDQGLANIVEALGAGLEIHGPDADHPFETTIAIWFRCLHRDPFPSALPPGAPQPPRPGPDDPEEQFAQEVIALFRSGLPTA